MPLLRLSAISLFSVYAYMYLYLPRNRGLLHEPCTCCHRRWQSLRHQVRRPVRYLVNRMWAGERYPQR
ncbi:hypothetical protein BC826DRAFT_1056416 [Russula brevipes]|nr:hypothetical protein BC826DRAFT_1056416 [Russula brevipes]